MFIVINNKKLIEKKRRKLQIYLETHTGCGLRAWTINWLSLSDEEHFKRGDECLVCFNCGCREEEMISDAFACEVDASDITFCRNCLKKLAEL
jgi:hypothetical protein